MDHLLQSKGDTAQLQEDAARYGIVLEPHHLAPAEYGLWAELWPVVHLFMRCMTQWRTGPGGLVGLDYGAVWQMAGILGQAVDAAMMEDILQLELQARDVLNRRQR